MLFSCRSTLSPMKRKRSAMAPNSPASLSLPLSRRNAVGDLAKRLCSSESPFSRRDASRLSC